MIAAFVQITIKLCGLRLLRNTLVFDTVWFCGFRAQRFLQPVHVLGVVTFVEVNLAFVTVVNDVGRDTVKEPTEIGRAHV